MRRQTIRIFVVTIILTVFISGRYLSDKSDSLTVGVTTSEVLTSSPTTKKYVTKSLKELGRMDDFNKYFLFLNSVPKSGSEILILLLQKLQGLNNFKHVRLRDGNKRHLKTMQQETLVDEIYYILKNQAVPLSFDRHVYFLNFSSFDKQFPTYINLIRNPIENIVSRIPFFNEVGEIDYYYRCLFKKKRNCNFKTGHSYDLSIPYFCGQDAQCMKLNNKWALQQAKSNVDRYYSVVGILEELNVTLQILENEVPYFFKGVRNMYENELLYIEQARKKLNVPSSVRKLLKKTMVKEIEFYEWSKSRLLKQFKG